MSNDISVKLSMDAVRPISHPRDTDGQIKAVTSQERDSSVNSKRDEVVKGNDVPAESRSVNETSEASLDRIVAELNQQAQQIRRDLEFSVDKDLNKTVITVKDSSSEEVIRQIPSEEVLTVARMMKDGDGTLISVKA